MPATTRVSLIERICDPQDAESWADFVALYGPFVYEIARQRGLQDSDACDVVQEVMHQVMRSIVNFDADPSRGHFRGWIRVITRRTLIRHYRQNQNRNRGKGGSTAMLELYELPDDRDDDRWESEHRRHLFRWAAERVRGEFLDRTWRAFWMNTVEELPAKDVADICEISVGAVYIAKSRVIRRIREQIQRVVDLEVLP